MKKNRPLSKIASDKKFEGESERRTAVYFNVHEDSSTESTDKLPAEVEFPNRANRPLWKATVLTLFPNMFPGPLEQSIAGKALLEEKWSLHIEDLRIYSKNKHQNVDDKPFGGGTGLVINPVVIGDAIDSINKKDEHNSIVYLTPRGALFNQKIAEKLIKKKNVLFVCGRYEGIDQRTIDHYKMEEISIGDYILSGGELAAQVVIDSCVRLLPDVIKKESALHEESFSSHSIYKNLLEYPHYTRPAIWKDMIVPDILTSGDHAKIEAWRLNMAEEITKKRRKDLWKNYLKGKKDT